MTRIKICGLKRPEDVAAVNAVLPDYIGFVFAGEKRRISRETARQLKALLDPRIASVGGVCQRGAGKHRRYRK